MKLTILTFVFLFILTVPAVVFGAGEGAITFIPLVGIPGVDPNSPDGLGYYINAIYRLSISLAALLAVVKIVIAGAKYMLDDIVTHKEEAKQDIWGAIMGLLVILGAVLILTTINSDLTNTNLLIDKVVMHDTNTDGTAGTPIDFSNVKSQTEACQVIETTGHSCVIDPLLPSFCTDFGFTACDSEAELGDFCTKELHGYTSGSIGFFNTLKCTSSSKDKADLITRLRIPLDTAACTDTGNTNCSKVPCTALNDSDTGTFSCISTCGTVGGKAPTYPFELRINNQFVNIHLAGEDYCVVPTDKIKPLAIVPGAFYYVDNEPIHIVSTKSIGGKVIVQYPERQMWFGANWLRDQTVLVSCGEITASETTVPPVCSL